MWGRSCRARVWADNGYVVTRYSRPKIPARCFTLTAPCHKNLPLFPSESSSPDLASLIDELHDKIFIPSILPEEQRKSLYKESKKEYLERSPIELNIDGVKLFFKGGRQYPRQTYVKQSLERFIAAIREPADWDNLPPLLEGMKTAKIEVRPKDIQRLVRKAGEARRIDVVLQCTRNHWTTKVDIQDKTILSEVVYAIRQPAYASGWTEEQTTTALKLANQLLVLLQTSIKGIHREDPRASAEVLGLLLELHSRNAITKSDGNDEDGQVAKYVGLLRNNWAQYDLQGREKGTRIRYALDSFLQRIVPVWSALDIAGPILGRKESTQELSGWAQRTQGKLGAQLEECYKSCLELTDNVASRWRGSLMYQSELLKKNQAEDIPTGEEVGDNLEGGNQQSESEHPASTEKS